MEANGGMAPLIEKYNLPLISAYGGPNLLDPAQRKDSIAQALEQGKLLKKYGGKVLVIGPNGVRRDTYNFKEHKDDIVATLIEKYKLPLTSGYFTVNVLDPAQRKDSLEKAVRFAVEHGLPSMYVTEDTTRTDAATVKRLYRCAIDSGARAIVLCDTAGHATPMGTFALVQFIIKEVVKPSGEKIRVDWHGHCDRGLAIANSMAALVAGAECVHATGLGIGERVGNTQMDQMLLNLKLMGIPPWADQDLTKLKEYCQAVSRATGVPIPANYPVVGEDAFRTATGVHAAAVIKAYKKNDIELANTVYSGVPSHVFGLEQIIDIGPMSGKSNVLFWLDRRGIPASDDVVESIYRRAKASDHTLSEAEILECVEGVAPH
jgi:2-isopropylmalate synthase